MKHAARLMLSLGHGGVILNVSSVNGQQPGEGQSAYCAAKAGVDMPRLQADIGTHSEQITALLRRNLAEADSMGLQGTPVYLVGPFKIAEAMDEEHFKKAVSLARERQAAK